MPVAQDRTTSGGWLSRWGHGKYVGQPNHQPTANRTVSRQASSPTFVLSRVSRCLPEVGHRISVHAGRGRWQRGSRSRGLARPWTMFVERRGRWRCCGEGDLGFGQLIMGKQRISGRLTSAGLPRPPKRTLPRGFLRRYLRTFLLCVSDRSIVPNMLQLRAKRRSTCWPQLSNRHKLVHIDSTREFLTAQALS